MKLFNCTIHTLIEHVDTLTINAPENRSVLLPVEAETKDDPEDEDLRPDENAPDTDQSLVVKKADRTLESCEAFPLNRFFDKDVSERQARRLVDYLCHVWNEERRPTAVVYAFYAMDAYINSDVDSRQKEVFFHTVTGSDKGIATYFSSRFQRASCFQERVEEQKDSLKAWLRPAQEDDM